MNQYQIAYAIAKEQYEAAHKATFEYTTELYEDPNVTDEMLEAGELEADEKFHVNEAYEILKTAEVALIDWSKRKVNMVTMLEEKAAVAIAYKAAETSVKARNQIIEAAMKLS